MSLELVTDQRILYSRTYYTVMPLWHGFRLHNQNELWQEMCEWCRNKLGASHSWPDMWSPFRHYWYEMDYCFWFRESQDREKFIKKFTRV